MERKPNVQYIRYYTGGSVARQLEPKTPKKKTTLPKVKQQPKQTLYIQPIAVAGILISAVMLVMMIIGSTQLYAAKQQELEMENYVHKLTWENAQAREQYEMSLDLEAIKKSALALGMVPQEQVRSITISVSMPEAEGEEPIFWQKVTAFFEGLFA